MGGTIAMIIRKPQGHEPEVQPMLRWTNIMPHFFGHSSFLAGAFDRWWPSFTKEWEHMRKDYEASLLSGKTLSPMTACYFPCEDKAPCGYGLVVVDFQTKTLLQSQGYCEIGKENLYRWCRLEPEEVGDLRRKYRDGLLKDLLIECVDGNKFVEFHIPVKGFGLKGLDVLLEMSQYLYSEKTPRTLGQACEALGVAIPDGANPKLPTQLHRWAMSYSSDWKFESFDESAAGYAQLRKRCEELGFDFTLSDDKAWHASILDKLDLCDFDDRDDLTPEEIAQYKAEMTDEIAQSLGVLGWPLDADELQTKSAAKRGLRP